MLEAKNYRERLLDATDELMYKRGYETVSVADLCATADARKGSFIGDRRSNNLALAMLDRA
jgi:AcrR family transcriptional regulator